MHPRVPPTWDSSCLDWGEEDEVLVEGYHPGITPHLKLGYPPGKPGLGYPPKGPMEVLYNGDGVPA